jgi:hypothetical protein
LKLSANVEYGNGILAKIWLMEFDCTVRRQQLKFALSFTFLHFLLFLENISYACASIRVHLIFPFILSPRSPS